MDVYDIGNKVRVSASFTNVASGDAVDPDVVMFHWRRPAGARVTYTYGTDVELVKDDVGEYHVDLDLDKKGEWNYRWQSTGDGQAADHGSFTVLGTVV